MTDAEELRAANALIRAMKDVVVSRVSTVFDRAWCAQHCRIDIKGEAATPLDALDAWRELFLAQWFGLVLAAPGETTDGARKLRAQLLAVEP